MKWSNNSSHLLSTYFLCELAQRLVAIFCRGPESTVLVVTAQICCCSTKAAKDNIIGRVPMKHGYWTFNLIQFLHVTKYFFFLIFFNPQPRICSLILERIEGRETWSVASGVHPIGIKPKLRYLPWPVIKPATFWCMGWCTNQPTELPSRGRSVNFCWN